MDWFLGKETRSPLEWTIRPRTLDIDVVGDVYRILHERWEGERRRAQLESGPGEWIDLDAREPKIQLIAAQPFDMYLQSANVPTLPPERVPNLSGHERSMIIVSGAGMVVDFRRGVRARIAGNHVDKDFTSEIEPIATLIARAGRVRPLWRNLLQFGPLLAALGLTAVGVWMLLTEHVSLPTVLFTIAIILMGWVSAWGVSRRLRVLYYPGHRFRDVSRSALRDRLTNARANAIVAVVTIPITAIVTWLMTLIFGD